MKNRITNKLMMTFLLAAICLCASNAALSQTQEILWVGAVRTSGNTNNFFDAARTADILKQSSENLSNHSVADSNDKNISQQESIYSSLMNFLFSFVK